MQSHHRRYTLHIGGDIRVRKYKKVVYLLNDIIGDYDLKSADKGYYIYISEVVQPHKFRKIEKYLLNVEIDFHRYQAGHGSDTNMSLPQHLFYVDGKRNIVECHYEDNEPCFRLDDLKNMVINNNIDSVSELFNHLEDKVNIEKILPSCKVESIPIKQVLMEGDIKTALYI